MKVCNKEGCKNPVFSNGYCRYHYKGQNKPIEALSPIKRYNIPSRSKKAFRHDYWGYKNQIELFVGIWLKTEKKDRVCWLTNEKLSDVFNLSYFAHILPKSRYTYWKLNPNNIKLLHPDVHNKVDNFIAKYYDDYPDIPWDKWFSLQEEMKVMYKEFKKENLLS